MIIVFGLLAELLEGREGPLGFILGLVLLALIVWRVLRGTKDRWCPAKLNGQMDPRGQSEKVRGTLGGIRSRKKRLLKWSLWTIAGALMAVAISEAVGLHPTALSGFGIVFLAVAGTLFFLGFKKKRESTQQSAHMHVLLKTGGFVTVVTAVFLFVSSGSVRDAIRAYDRGIRALETGDWDAAIEALSAVQAEYPDYKDVTQRLSEVKFKKAQIVCQQAQAALEQAKAVSAQGQFKAAIDSTKRVITLLKKAEDFPESAKLLSEAKQLLASIGEAKKQKKEREKEEARRLAEKQEAERRAKEREKQRLSAITLERGYYIGYGEMGKIWLASAPQKVMKVLVHMMVDQAVSSPYGTFPAVVVRVVLIEGERIRRPRVSMAIFGGRSLKEVTVGEQEASITAKPFMMDRFAFSGNEEKKLLFPYSTLGSGGGIIVQRTRGGKYQMHLAYSGQDKAEMTGKFDLDSFRKVKRLEDLSKGDQEIFSGLEKVLSLPQRALDLAVEEACRRMERSLRR